MKIVGVETFMVSVPYTRPEKWAWGVRRGSSPLIVRLMTDEGLVGLGEAAAPFTTGVLQQVVEQHIVPNVVGQDPFDLEPILSRIMASGLGWVLDASTQAVSAVEIALWDLIGKAVSQPVYKLLGGKVRARVPFGAYLFYDSPAAMAEEAARLVGLGINTVKMKVGIDPREDIERVRRVRAAVGPDVAVIVDPNQSWSPGTAVREIGKLAEFDPMFIEQPVKKDDLEGMRRVRQAVAVPIGANESVTTPASALQVIRHEAADILVTDVEVAGGILACKKIAAIAEAAGIPVIGHSGGELGIATAALLHVVASSPSFIHPNDTYYYYQADDIITEPFVLEQGHIAVPEGPGLGVELDEAKVARYRTNTFYSAFGADREEMDWVPSWSRL